MRIIDVDSYFNEPDIWFEKAGKVDAGELLARFAAQLLDLDFGF